MFNVKICYSFICALIFICILFSLNLYSKGIQNTPKYILNMKEIAEKGNSDVQYNLGLIYSNGEDVEKDLEEAIYWFKESASLSNVLAEYKLGYIYDNGLGVEKDSIKAYKYYLSAGQKGNADAQYNLCLLYTSPSPRDKRQSRMPSSA